MTPTTFPPVVAASGPVPATSSPVPFVRLLATALRSAVASGRPSPVPPCSRRLHPGR
ncbi:hypothetical protein [Motilibacter aurantiacus]|uniref:hypothetical protein n=1 Tax=Motilibacter aurantiacus TaxID=2714955 RepID=UPI0014084486|nr:hypothetical protein [Motilibacter aurantiacus]NHC44950.1 hypothetical protein [Motilibacter aurantiacus]